MVICRERGGGVRGERGKERGRKGENSPLLPVPGQQSRGPQWPPPHLQGRTHPETAEPEGQRGKVLREQGEVGGERVECSTARVSSRVRVSTLSTVWKLLRRCRSLWTSSGRLVVPTTYSLLPWEPEGEEVE